MRTRWIVVLLATMLVSAVSAFAGPTIGGLEPACPTGGNNAPPPGANYFDVVNNGSNVNFNNFASINGGGVFIFCNDSSNQTAGWTQAAFAVTNFLGSSADGIYNFDTTGYTGGNTNNLPPITCTVGSGSDQAFLNCVVSITDSRILINFSGTGNGVNGVQPNQTLWISLDTPLCPVGATCTDSGGWKNPDGSPVTFSGGANLDNPNSLQPVPEPASLLLLGSGIAALLMKQRKRT